MILDSFKSLLKQPEWPLMLILSGVDSLVHHITSEEQLAYLMRPVSFTEIAMHHPDDLAELVSLCHAYADKAGLDFSGLNTRDFYERLTCACANRWGLVIELLIDAFVIALDGARPSPARSISAWPSPDEPGCAKAFPLSRSTVTKKLFEAQEDLRNLGEEAIGDQHLTRNLQPATSGSRFARAFLCAAGADMVQNGSPAYAPNRHGIAPSAIRHEFYYFISICCK
jgi:hypothetical protein